MRDMFGYHNKRVVVTGAASGMGQATVRLLAELGAEIYAIDVKELESPVNEFIKTDLAVKDSIDNAAKRIPENIHALFNCAGVPGPPFSNLEVMLVNFVGLRHLTETLIPEISDGGAIASISSIAGATWKGNLETIKELLATTGFDEARSWLEANPESNNGYGFSKECIIAYTKSRTLELGARNIRINTISPAPTATPMMPDFIRIVGKDVLDAILPPCGRQATPEEMAEPLVFLNSNMARYISGQDIQIDFGLLGGVEVG